MRSVSSFKEGAGKVEPSKGLPILRKGVSAHEPSPVDKGRDPSGRDPPFFLP